MRKKDKEIYEETDMIDAVGGRGRKQRNYRCPKEKEEASELVIVPVIGGIVVVAVNCVSIYFKRAKRQEELWKLSKWYEEM